jgi:uncharacterized BrkB/YihY/UPF0761 family membrane protein
MELDSERIETRHHGVAPTLRYWMEVEVHVYAFSVAANVLLSFFPFLIVLVSICRYVFHWDAAEQTIYLGLRDFFPGETGEFLARNLSATVYARGPFQLMSIFLLLFTANGIFEPLEVALNRVWGISQNRPYWKNQLVSLGLIFACGTLAVLSTTLTAMNPRWLTQLLPPQTVANILPIVIFKVAALPATVGVLFLVYWLLPNAKLRKTPALVTSIYVAVGLEALKYLNLLIWPWLYQKFRNEYGPFVNSVTIVVWGFSGAMIIMGGAEWTARHLRNRDKLLA